MYLYKHKTTGAVVASPTPCTGENWEPVNVLPEKAEKPADEAPKKKTAAKRGK